MYHNPYILYGTLYHISKYKSRTIWKGVRKMPRDEFKTVTVSEELYKKLSELADKEHRSISKQVAHLVEKELKQKAKEASC